MQNANPLKRAFPTYEDEAPEFERVAKKFLRTPGKGKDFNENEVEERHFLLIKNIKNISPKIGTQPEIKSEGKGMLVVANEPSMKEKQRLVQKEIEIYREQMAFYEEDCCLFPTRECQIKGAESVFPYKLN